MRAAPEFDAFETLGLPSQLDLPDEEIENAWRELSRKLHPDTESGDAEKAANVNRAREILGHSSSRLRHWLEYQGVEIGRDTVIADGLMNLFAEVGPLLHEVDALLKEKSTAASALGKALLAEREMASQQNLQGLLSKIQNRLSDITDEFPAFETASESEDYSGAIAATGTIGFLEKWKSQCQERLVDLISA